MTDEFDWMDEDDTEEETDPEAVADESETGSDSEAADPDENDAARQRLQDAIDNAPGEVHRALAEELLFIHDERVARQRAEALEARVEGEGSYLDFSDPEIQEGLRHLERQRAADLDRAYLQGVEESAKRRDGYSESDPTPDHIRREVADARASMEARYAADAAIGYNPDPLLDNNAFRAYQVEEFLAQRSRDFATVRLAERRDIEARRREELTDLYAEAAGEGESEG